MSASRISLGCLALLMSCVSASSAPFTWNGAAGSGEFTDGGNWVGGIAAPTGSDLLFGLDLGAGFAGLNAGAIFNAPTVTFLASASQSFHLTALTPSDVLNITGSGITVTNLSSFRMSTQTMTVNVAGSQTWDGGANGLSIFAVDLGNNRTLTFTGTGASATTRNEILFGIDGTGLSGVTKEGSGTLQFSGSNLYTGATTISNGVLQLGASERIFNTSNLVLNGGTFSTAGFDEFVGKLSLTNFSVIDFGSSNTSDLAFALSSDQNWGAFTINVTNFNQGFDTLRFGTDSSALTSAQLANFRFNGTTPAQIDVNGFVTPVPEPSAFGFAVLGGIGLMAGWRRRIGRS